MRDTNNDLTFHARGEGRSVRCLLRLQDLVAHVIRPSVLHRTHGL